MVDRYRSEIIRETERFAALQASWDDLYGRAVNPEVTQSFEWVSAAWEAVGNARSGRLNILVLRERDRVVLIWPLAVYGHRRHWRAVHPVVLYGDSVGPLVEDSHAASRIVSDAVDLVRDGQGYDLFISEWVKKESMLARALDSQAPIISEGHQGVSWRNVSEWEEYERGISGRREIKRRLRRLHEAGQVDFNILQDASAQLPLVEWLVEQKIRRFAEIGDTPLWDPAQQQAFTTAAIRTVRKFGRFLFFTITLNGNLLAALIAIRDGKTLTIYQHTQQAGFEKFGPGILIWHICIKYAFDNGLGVNFGSGRSEYKRMFANSDTLYSRWILPTSVWGRLRTGMTRLGDWQRKRLAAKREGS
jgi:CelD/BcsL family acetyltransferase involved in cellulose biosynthesis